jgi:hypothetical protein
MPQPLNMMNVHVARDEAANGVVTKLVMLLRQRVDVDETNGDGTNVGAQDVP